MVPDPATLAPQLLLQLARTTDINHYLVLDAAHDALPLAVRTHAVSAHVSKPVRPRRDETTPRRSNRPKRPKGARVNT